MERYRQTRVSSPNIRSDKKSEHKQRRNINTRKHVSASMRSKETTSLLSSRLAESRCLPEGWCVGIARKALVNLPKAKDDVFAKLLADRL